MIISNLVHDTKPTMNRDVFESNFKLEVTRHNPPPRMTPHKHSTSTRTYSSNYGRTSPTQSREHPYLSKRVLFQQIFLDRKSQRERTQERTVH